MFETGLERASQASAQIRTDCEGTRSRRASDAEIRAYLKRIGFAGSLAPTRELLRELHWRHLEAIPYENLDVQLERPVTRDPRAAFDKLVTNSRGGWCYEMNGLFGWILESLGFSVRRLAGAVMREKIGDAAVGNHLVLLVDLDQPYLADVGLGVGLIEPVPLAEGPFRQRFLRLGLEQVGAGWWRFRNHPGAQPPSFDFSPAVTSDAALEHRCRWLQSHPTSLFVQNAMVQRLFADRVETLVGNIHTVITGEASSSEELSDERRYRELLASRFGLTVDGTDRVWRKITDSAGQELVPALA